MTERAEVRTGEDAGNEERSEDRALLAAACAGRLGEHLDSPDGKAAIYPMLSRVIFRRITRQAELRRGHRRCAAGAERLEAACHDRHQDDVEALYVHLLGHLERHPGERIANLHGLLVTRAEQAAVDAYRRRRAERGALQRPRMTVWLASALGEDAWLKRLALDILEWVGVEATAGYGLWPLKAWARQRSATLPGPAFTEAEMGAEVQRVLDVMRAQRPAWYAAHVERPLGFKQAPLRPAQRTDVAAPREPEYVRHTDPDEQAEALLRELAGAALERAEALVARGAPLREAVAQALAAAFGVGVGGGGDPVPTAGAGTPPSDPRERARLLIAEPAVFERVVAAVAAILRPVRQIS